MKQLLYFSSHSCAPCRAMLPLVEAIAAEQSIQLTKYDRDEASELARCYGVQGVPCLILVTDGVPGDRLVGLYPRGKIEALVKG